MDKLRDFIKSWPGRIALLLCLAPMVFLGMEGYFAHGRLSPDQVAKVGQTPVELADVQAQANEMRLQLLQEVDASAIDEDALFDQALEILISRALLQEQARALGMQVSDEAIAALLRQDPTFADENGQFSNDRFAAFLQQNHLNKDALFAMQRNQLNLRALMNGILSTAIYTRPEVERLIGLQSEVRKLWIKRFAWQKYADQATVSDDEIQAAYQESKDDLTSPAMVDLNYIELAPTDVAVDAPSDDELKAAYQAYLQENNLGQKRLAQILLTGDDAQSVAADIQKQLSEGGDFAQLAKRYSDDPSGQAGGDIGAYNRAVFGDEANKVDAVVLPLSVGQIGAPVQTRFGVHIFKVTGEDDAPSFDGLKATLSATLQEQKRQAQFVDRVSLINNLVADGLSLKDIAAQTNTTVKTLADYQDRDQSVMGQPAIAKAAFDDFLIQDRGVSSNIEILGAMLWLEPTRYRPSAPLTYEQAAPVLKQRLIAKKARDLALEDAKAQAATVDRGNVEALTASGVLTFVGEATRQSEFLDEAERASLFSHDAKDGVVAWATPSDVGASLMVGSAVEKQSVNEEARSTAALMMKNVAGQDYLEDYLRYLKDTHTVQMNDDLLKNF